MLLLPVYQDRAIGPSAAISGFPENRLLNKFCPGPIGPRKAENREGHHKDCGVVIPPRYNTLPSILEDIGRQQAPRWQIMS